MPPDTDTQKLRLRHEMAAMPPQSPAARCHDDPSKRWETPSESTVAHRVVPTHDMPGRGLEETPVGADQTRPFHTVASPLPGGTATQKEGLVHDSGASGWPRSPAPMAWAGAQWVPSKR